jgi:L-alanine-DL-glutamate epimerase-like enolase superfamily enzyme
MNITRLTLNKTCIPLNYQFIQSNNSGSRNSSAAIISLMSDSGNTGYGEACPRTYVTGENIHTMKNDLERIKKSLFSCSIYSFEDLFQFATRHSSIGPATSCALELALLDLWSKEVEKPIHELIQVDMDFCTEYGIAIPLYKPEFIKNVLETMPVREPAFIKIKNDADVEGLLLKLEVIKNHFGQDVEITIDGNGGLTFQEANTMINLLYKKGVYSYEQLLPVHDLDGYRKLNSIYGKYVNIILDESLVTIEDARTAIKYKTCNAFNLKISKCGGITKTKAIYDQAQNNGISCRMGAHFGETGILSKAQGISNAMMKDLTHYEGLYGAHLLKEDVVEPSPMMDRNGVVNWGNFKNELGWANVNTNKYSQSALDLQANYSLI